MLRNAFVISLGLLQVAAEKKEAYSVDLKHGGVKSFDGSALMKCVGSSHAATGLRADWQQQLKKVHEDLGPEFIRFHGLFDDDMSAVVPGSRPHRKVPLAKVDQTELSNCTFITDQDYADPGGPVFKTKSQQECCEACYTKPTGLPDPCVAAVWTPSGDCYFKLATNQPLKKKGSGIASCVTNRPSPKGFQYSWTNIFKLFDFLRSIGMRPIVELSFMPSLLASDPSLTCFWYKGGISPPKDYNVWRDFISQFVTAIIDRYGATEVHQWYFEVWNEPNCGFFYDPKCCGPTCGNKTAYMELFTNTFKAIKSVDPSLRVGGPASAQLAWLGEFLTNATLAGTVPDFLSTHLYPTDPYIDHGRDSFSGAIADAASEVAESARRAGGKVPPLFLTEFNCGLGIECQDAPFAASFVAHHAKLSQGMRESVPIQSFWTFSDIFEEQGQMASEFSQAFGMQTISGIAKPVYRSFQLLRRLHGESVDVKVDSASLDTSIDVVVTKQDSVGTVSVEALVTNHPNMSQSTRAVNTMHTHGLKHHPEVSSEDQAPTHVALSFKGLPEDIMSFNVTERRIDDAHSNAVVHYMKLGAPDQPSKAVIEKLHRESELAATSAPAVKQQDGSLRLTLDMPPYSVVSISFTYPNQALSFV